MSKITEAQQEILKGLKKSYEEAKGDKELLEVWKKEISARTAELIKTGVTFSRIVNAVGCSRELVASAIHGAGHDELLSSFQLKLVHISKENLNNEESEIIKKLQKSYADAKSCGLKAVRTWGKDNREAIKRLVSISEKSPYQLGKLIGCNPVVFTHDERKNGKVTPLKPNKPKEFNLEFWDSLIDTGKVGDIMTEALKSLFDQLDEKNKEIAALIKERDGYKKALDGAEVELKKISAKRKIDLAASVHKALASPGETSLNGN